jgi:hypothetical protein
MKHDTALALILAALLGGMCIGRFACCPKSQSVDITLTSVESPAQGGEGILVPEQPGPSIAGISVPEVEPLGHTWHKFTDQYISIRVRAVQADTVQYEFKKQWHEFRSEVPGIESLLVYGVAPESVRVKGKVPEPSQPGSFSAMLLTGISIDQHLALHEIDLLEAQVRYKRIYTAGRLLLFPVEYEDEIHLNWKFVFDAKYRIF